jgi:hypothetical protein
MGKKRYMSWRRRCLAGLAEDVAYGQKLRAVVLLFQIAKREVTALPLSSGVSFCFLFFRCQAVSPFVLPALPCFFLSQTPHVSNFPVFFPCSLSFVPPSFFCSYFFTSLFQARLLSFLSLLRLFFPPFFSLVLVLRVVFIAQRGAGSTLSPPYHRAWGAGPSCPVTALDEVANGCGLQGTTPLVSHHEGAWSFGLWQSTRGEREARRSKEEKNKNFIFPCCTSRGRRRRNSVA